MNIAGKIAGKVAGDVAQAASGAAGESALRLVPKPWKDGMCDCMEESQSCLDVFLCYPCQISRQCKAIDGTKDEMDIMYCLGGSVAPYFMGYFGLGLTAMIIRYRMVEKYNIINEPAHMTLCIGCALPCCSLCQTNRMLMLLQQNPSGTCYKPPPLGVGIPGVGNMI